MTRMKNHLTSGVAAGFLGLVVLGGLSACEDEKTEQAQGTGTGGNGTSSEQSSTDDEANQDAKDDDAAQSASPTGCLVGTWLADNKQLGTLFKSAAAGTPGAGSVSDPTGKVLVTFGPEGQYGVNYQKWTMSLSQQGMTIDLVRDGTDTGSYKASDAGDVEWTEVKMASVASMKTPAGVRQVPASEPSNTSGTFTCEKDTLEIVADGSTSVLLRQS